MDASSRNAGVKDLLSKMSTLIEGEDLDQAKEVLGRGKGATGRVRT